MNEYEFGRSRVEKDKSMSSRCVFDMFMKSSSSELMVNVCMQSSISELMLMSAYDG